MATSGTTSWTLTETDIITEAMEDIGVLEAGDTPSADDITSARRSLNLILKSLQSDPSIALRFIEDKTISLSDGTTSYALDADTKKVLRVWLRIDGTDTQLNIVSKESYDLLSSKSGENQPMQVYIDYAPDTPKAYFYPTPGQSYTAYYASERVVEDMTSATDNVDLPTSALEMVVAGLRSKLSSKFGLPIQERGYWDNKYTMLKRDFRAGDTNRSGKETVRPNFVV